MMKCKGDCLFNIDGKCTRQSKKDMTVIGKWKNDFKRFISELSMPEDDFYGIMQYIDEAPNETEWIPVSERLPEDIRPVIVTWKNNDPASYYQYIVGKHFIGAAHYLKGKWYWYSSTTEDFLAEYGRYEGEEFDEAIEVIAWKPLPQPYEPQERSDKA